MDEIIMLYKGKVIFRQYIPKKHKRFGIKHSQHWPSKGKQRRCCVCLLKKTDTEQAALLQQMWCQSVHSELLWEVARHVWTCELLDTAALTVAAQSNSYRCTAGTENIYSVNKCCGFVKCNITHASSVKYGVGALKIHRNIIKYITQNNFLIYENVLWVRFSAKHWYLSYKRRILFSFKQFLFQNFMLYGAENISIFVEACNFKI